MKSGTNFRKVLNKLNEIDFNIAKDRHAFGELYETILKELKMRERVENSIRQEL